MDEQNTQGVVEKKTNGFAIAGLVCSIVVGWITGLIFSIIGLKKSKVFNSGKGLALAGLIISIIRAVFFLLIVVIFILIMQTDEYQEGFDTSFCYEMEDSKDECTKLDDGTYDCIYAICDFDDVIDDDDEDDTYIENDELSLDLTVDAQALVIANVLSSEYENVTYQELTNDDLLYLIYKLYSFDTISSDDMRDAVLAHFDRDIELTDGANPIIGTAAIKYDAETDTFIHDELGIGVGRTARYEYEISRMEEDGMLIINVGAVYYYQPDVGIVNKIYYDKDLQNEIEVDAAYIDEYGSIDITNYIHDHYDTLPQFRYTFEIYGDKVNFVSLQKIK